MRLTDEIISVLNERLALLREGESYSAAEWFGQEGWDQLGTPGDRRALGREIHNALRDGLLAGMTYQGIRQNGRCNVYMRDGT